MGNPYRGEVELTVNGAPVTLRLTLGALAELEDGLGEDSILGLVERFETGGFNVRDIAAVIRAGLAGGGVPMDPGTLAEAEIDGGPMAAARAAARLLNLTFAVPE
ncbi:MAG: gene transfer agent family protein [Pseudomonadota bacterium]